MFCNDECTHNYYHYTVELEVKVDTPAIRVMRYIRIRLSKLGNESAYQIHHYPPSPNAGFASSSPSNLTSSLSFPTKMFRAFSKIPLRRTLHTSTAGAARRTQLNRVALAGAASAAAATYLAWRASSPANHIALDAPQSTSKHVDIL